VRHPVLATLECFKLSRAVSKTYRRGCAFCACARLGARCHAVAQFPAIRDTTVLSILYYVIAGCGLGVAGNAADFSYHQHQRNHSLDTRT
jgi:hypothetical protein